MDSAAIPQRIDYHHAELSFFSEQYKISPKMPQQLKHKDLVQILKKMTIEHPAEMKLDLLGESVENRDIFHVTIGKGPRSVLMWSQMHGNEPTATNALIDIFNFLLQEKENAFVQEILNGATLHCIPMVNPDGSELFLRRNAQGLDLNRDARELASPEARILKSLHERLRPEFALNLHDMNGRRTIENTNKLIAIALMVPPFDANDNNNPSRIEAKRLASVMQQALSPYIYEHISRYDADFMPAAFGDNFQSWGTRTVLLETGGWYQEGPGFLVKLNFIAILEACHAIATGSYAQANPGLYDALPTYDKELFDLLIKGAKIFDGINPEPFKCDLGVNFIETDTGAEREKPGVFTDIGDMRSFTAKNNIDGSDLLVLPGLIGLLPPDCGDCFLDDNFVQDYLQRGYTTLLVEYDLQRKKRLKTTLKKLKNKPLRINVAFVVALDSLANFPLNEQATALGDALADGAVAVLSHTDTKHSYHPLAEKIVHWLHRPEYEAIKIQANKDWRELFNQHRGKKTTQHFLKQGLMGRGRIRVNDFADIVVYKYQESEAGSEIDKPEMVFVNGHLAYSRKKAEGYKKCGSIILR